MATYGRYLASLQGFQVISPNNPKEILDTIPRQPYMGLRSLPDVTFAKISDCFQRFFRSEHLPNCCTPTSRPVPPTYPFIGHRQYGGPVDGAPSPVHSQSPSGPRIFGPGLELDLLNFLGIRIRLIELFGIRIRRRSRTGPVLVILLVKFLNHTPIVVSKTQNAVFRSLVVGDYQTLHISHGILTVIL